MSIRLECPNATCGKAIHVNEEYAGQAVKCQACGTVLKVPAAGAGPAPANVNPTEAASAPAAAASFWTIIERQCLASRLDALARNLFAGGLAALVLLAVSTFFNWVSISFGGFRVGTAGIQSGMGVLVFLLSLAAAGFAGFAFFKKPELFPYGIYGAGGWGALMSLYFLVQILRAGSLAGFGLYLGTLAALGTAAAFGTIVFRQVKK
jgi:hypothetical protein